MKKFYTIIILCIFITSCNNRFKNDREAIQVFKDTMGNELVQTLDVISKNVDSVLVETYKTKNVDVAYLKFLEYLISSPTEYSLQITNEKVTELLNKFELNSYRQEVWNIEKVNKIDVLSTNLTGKFLNAMQKIDTLDCQAKGYFDTRSIAGMPSYSLMAKHIIDKNLDLDNYLIKTIIVSDFFYFVLQSTNYNRITKGETIEKKIKENLKK
ncbi:hypothetical protein [uncultured Draconibacterium sp.]|uniref:hypothetical protein n=1 Tax=uncultured Draconibacterium sp. TaxID=1573823 RepID=UPI003216D536